jgi:hypothetical protein
MTNSSLRHGDLVEIRSPAEILATLDEHGALDNLIFMPEMALQCGTRHRVYKTADKVCDTVTYTGSRRMPDSVLLEMPRCDGSAHGGCEAECRIFWKNAWLKPVRAEDPPAPKPDPADLARLVDLATKNVNATVQVEGKPEIRWTCQSTNIVQATQRLGTFDPRPFVQQYTCGNVDFPHFLKVSTRALVQEPMRKFGLIPEAHLAGPGTWKASEYTPLDLKPGELVRIKDVDAIRATLNEKGYNRGLWFDREMMQYCGGTFRVHRIVRKFIDERFGKLVALKTDCVTLENVVCSGDYSLRRWFCPRDIYPYWRDCWLERVAG